MATRILGIDPGSRVTGYALIEVSGSELRVLGHDVIKPLARSAFSDKILFVADRLGGLIDLYAPQEAAVEDLFHAVNARASLQLAHLRGGILLELARKRVELSTYAPTAVKKALTGVGSAGKEQVRFMVERILGLKLGRGPNDVSDALAVAVCHAHTRRGFKR